MMVMVLMVVMISLVSWKKAIEDIAYCDNDEDDDNNNGNDNNDKNNNNNNDNDFQRDRGLCLLRPTLPSWTCQWRWLYDKTDLNDDEEDTDIDDDDYHLAMFLSRWFDLF